MYYGGVSVSLGQFPAYEGSAIASPVNYNQTCPDEEEVAHHPTSKRRPLLAQRRRCRDSPVRAISPQNGPNPHRNLGLETESQDGVGCVSCRPRCPLSGISMALSSASCGGLGFRLKAEEQKSLRRLHGPGAFGVALSQGELVESLDAHPRLEIALVRCLDGC
jgi:hypothetical protein